MYVFRSWQDIVFFWINLSWINVSENVHYVILLLAVIDTNRGMFFASIRVRPLWDMGVRQQDVCD